MEGGEILVDADASLRSTKPCAFNGRYGTACGVGGPPYAYLLQQKSEIAGFA